MGGGAVAVSLQRTRSNKIPTPSVSTRESSAIARVAGSEGNRRRPRPGGPRGKTNSAGRRIWVTLSAGQWASLEGSADGDSLDHIVTVLIRSALARMGIA